MGREIEFRAWNTELKKFFYSDAPRDLNDDSRDWIPFEFCVGFRGDHTSRMILQQFIGLKDDNGKKMYEGDIIQCNQNCKKWVVRWEHFAWHLSASKTELPDDGVCDLWLYTKALTAVGGKIEVIGNIYETPEIV